MLAAMLGFGGSRAGNSWRFCSLTARASTSQAAPMTALPRKTKVLLVALVAVLAVAGAGFLFAWSGIYSVAASAGHWDITRWLLHFAMRSSVRTHTIGIEAPGDLESPRLIEMGAGHYHTGCAPCHGTVAGDPPTIPRGMTPHPPFLPPVVPEWEDDELFWVVKHGIKYTGMPAWPTQVRDDEVWAMVAFLRQMPELEAEGYRRLALGEMSDMGAQGQGEPGVEGLGGFSALGIADCARCHGSDGLGRESGAFPKLAGQSEEYLYRSLQSYAVGQRNSGIMQPIADGLSEAQQRALASQFAAMPPGGAAADDLDPDLVELGRKLADPGAPQGGVPSCASCHDSPQASPAYPRLAGQPAWYLEQQLYLFREGTRGGTAYADIMRSVAAGLSDEQIAAAAAYYASRDPVAPEASEEPE